MALSPTYKDVTWNGLKKYTMLNNDDGTMSFVDKTVYTNKEQSMFGAKDVNRIILEINSIKGAGAISQATIDKYVALGMDVSGVI